MRMSARMQENTLRENGGGLRRLSAAGNANGHGGGRPGKGLAGIERGTSGGGPFRRKVRRFESPRPEGTGAERSGTKPGADAIPTCSYAAGWNTTTKRSEACLTRKAGKELRKWPSRFRSSTAIKGMRRRPSRHRARGTGKEANFVDAARTRRLRGRPVRQMRG